MPLIYRDKGTSGTQIAVFSHELQIAHIDKEVPSHMTGGAVRWRYNFAFTAGPSEFEPHGHVDTLEDAKAAVEFNWRLWLNAAGLPGA